MAMNSVEFFGLPVISMGVTRSGEGLEELIYENTGKNIYKKVLLKGGSIAGMVFVNDIKSAGVIGGLMRKNIDVSSIRDSLLDEGFGFARIAALVKDNADKFDSEEFKDIALTY
jgi:NAD(P)H-nitrite reductase large subunit